ncbi:hypothetical protein U1Q18_028100, partial [Sarracenia purpurea var. burkii]
YVGKAKRISDSQAVGGKFPSDSERFRAPKEPRPKVHGPRQEPKPWVPSSALSDGVLSRQGSDMIFSGDVLSAALLARAPGQPLSSVAKAGARPPPSPAVQASQLSQAVE